MIRSGDLNRRIVIQRRADVVNVFNEPVPGWAEIASRPAKVTPVSDGERFGGGQEVQATLTHRFTVRWDRALWTAIDPTCRVLYDGRTFDIVAIKELGFREGVEITATARAE